MMDHDEMKRQLMATFAAELQDHRNTLSSGLLDLEKDPGGDERRRLVENLFRCAHSVKGAARAVDIADIEVIAHRMEDVLGAVQRKEIQSDPALVDVLLNALDAFDEALIAHQEGVGLPKTRKKAVLAQLDAALNGGELPMPLPEPSKARSQAKAISKKKPGQTPSEEDGAADSSRSSGTRKKKKRAGGRKRSPSDTTDAKAPGTDDSESAASEATPVNRLSAESIRVATAKIDALMDAMGELLVARMRKAQRLREVQNLMQCMRDGERTWRRSANALRRLNQAPHPDPDVQTVLETVSRQQRFMKQLATDLKQLKGRFDSDCRHQAVLTDELQQGVRRIRMVPISQLYEFFPRMVRDLGRQFGKPISLEFAGSDTEIDRQILEMLKDPLTHLLRNAVDHGIEMPAKRKAAGKSETGCIRLEAFPQGKHIVLTLSDDGGGIDVDAVRRKGGHETARDTAPDDAKRVGHEDLLDTIFKSGFSTKARVSDLSGRGIGLDVVKKNLERLNGRIKVTSIPGNGATFALTVPLTMATTHALLFKSGGLMLALPTTNVERILHLRPDDIGTIEGRPAIRFNGRALPLVSMAQVLRLPVELDRPAGQKRPAVVLGAAEQRRAFGIGELLSTQEVVVKGLGHQLRRVRHVAGATVLGSGQVAMMLNAASLIDADRHENRQASSAPSQQPAAAQKRVLVVDDSITTRTLEKQILENAGFNVLTAVDGMEGWDVIQRETLDLVVLDVDMPRMNGLELSEKIKKDKRFEELPVVLLTSLDSEDDRVRGMETGADAYLTKGTFDQQALLKTIDRLID